MICNLENASSIKNNISDIHLEDVDLSSEMEDLVEPELDELKSIKREINNLTEATQLSRSRNPSVVESEGKLLKIRIFFFFHLFSRLYMYVAVTCTY